MIDLYSNSRDEPASGARKQDHDTLAMRLEQQREKIGALELAAEERMRSDELNIQVQARRAQSRKQDLRRQRLARSITIKDRRLLSHRQDEMSQNNRQGSDLSRFRSASDHLNVARSTK